jgi:hypothetical protein
VTTTYNIRTKYNGNVRLNKHRESRKTPEPTYQRTKVKKRENKRQTIIHIIKVNILHKCLKVIICNSMQKWLKMSTLFTSG